MAGLHLDPWQEHVLVGALGRRADRTWSAFEVGLMVSRQNGKGSILEARELAGLFLLGERLIIHSAHEFPTSVEAFLRLEALIDSEAEFRNRVKRTLRSPMEKGFDMKNGQRIRFRTRTKGGGRGFSCDCLIYDEAMFVAEAHRGATLPTLSARPNPQVWYTGSAVDQEIHDNGVVFAQVRERGLAGDDPALAYFEWSVDAESPDEVTEAQATDPDMWAQSNPGLGIRISHEHLEREQRAMGARDFAVERLGVGDWPDTDPEGARLIPNWAELADLESEPARAVEFAFDVAPGFEKATIGVAGRRKDRLYHVEVVENRAGTGWLVDRICELVEKHQARGVTCDERGTAATFIPALKQRRVKVHTVNSAEYAQACGRFYTCCGVEDGDEPTLRHLGTTELEQAVRGAAQRPLGDAWAWSRKNSSVDITPLVACTLALHRASRPVRTGRMMA